MTHDRFWMTMFESARCHFILLAISISVAAPATCSPYVTARGPEVERDLAHLRETISSSSPLSATGLPGIYVVKDQSKENAATLVTADGKVLMNNGTLGMTYGTTGRHLSLSEEEQVIRPLLPYLGTDEMIQFGDRRKPLRMILLSGIDCPYCSLLEPLLRAKGIRYAVIPVALRHENETYVRRVYCAADRSNAWAHALASATAPPAPQTDCDFNEEHFWVLDGLLGGSTPRLLFADGELGRHASNEAGVTEVLKKINALERAGIAF